MRSLGFITAGFGVRRRLCMCAGHMQNRRVVSSNSDTVYAISSGVGKAGVAVVRVSGQDAKRCVDELCVSRPTPEPRRATLRKIFHPSSGELLDEALVLYFPGPKSFTGEDIAEFHVHGSYAVVKSVLSALSSVQAKHSNVIRPSERGEFTRRAFENGRMDLTEVEGLADLIASESTEQRRQALRQIGGELRRAYEAWREELKRCLAYAEAVIDFGEDVDESALNEVVPRVGKIREEMERSLSDGRRGEIIRSGIRIAILGPPNAGKSSLLNCLAKRPAAIVSPIAGTTRDVVEVSLDLAGLSVHVSDTAGIREGTDDPIELEGIRRAWMAREEANVSIYLIDASNVGSNQTWFATDEIGGNDLIVANKSDLCDAEEKKSQLTGILGPHNLRFISCKTGEGIAELLNELESRLTKTFSMGSQTDMPLVTRERHRFHLTACVDALDAFLRGCQAAGGELPLDIATEELRIAAKELGQITGTIQVEEVLDVVFEEFCIGK